MFSLQTRHSGDGLPGEIHCCCEAARVDLGRFDATGKKLHSETHIGKTNYF